MHKPQVEEIKYETLISHSLTSDWICHFNKVLEADFRRSRYC